MEEANSHTVRLPLRREPGQRREHGQRRVKRRKPTGKRAKAEGERAREREREREREKEIEKREQHMRPLLSPSRAPPSLFAFLLRKRTHTEPASF